MKTKTSKTRRTFLRTMPAAVAAGLSAPTSAQEAAPSKLGRHTLKCAEDIAGLSFTEAEEDLVLPNAIRYRENYEALRRVDVTDVDPAFSFRPPLPAGRGTGRATPGAPLKIARSPSRAVPTSLEELAFLPVTSLAPLVEARKLSSTDLTKMYLERLKRHDATLKCVITLTEELALAQAAAADREIARGRYRGPLHGIPWGVKDLYATRGIPTTWGAAMFQHQVIDRDATVVERLRDAGAVLLAKLSTGQLAVDETWFGGKTRNPWNPDLGSRGSSAGPAAATAAGLVGFSVGTETGGSIVLPSAACGVVGLRPTYGRISRHGMMALRWTMDKAGPLCRSVEDCALVFNALYGPDGRDDTVADLPFEWDPDRPLSSLRIGFVEKEFEDLDKGASEEAKRLGPQRKQVFREALDALRSAGAKLVPLALPDLPSAAVYRVLFAESGAVFDDLVRSGAASQLAGNSTYSRASQLRAARFIPAVEYIRAQRVRTLLLREIEALFGKHDVFLAPYDSESWQMTNMTGHPLLIQKAGFVEGLPQAIMVLGRLYDEGTLLRVALAFERATRWHTMHPKLTEA